MNERTRQKIDELLANPDLLIKKKPFTRGVKDNVAQAMNILMPKQVDVNEMIDAEVPRFKRDVVRQSQFLKELDTDSHKVLFDDNIPSITMKMKDGSYLEIEYKKMAVPFQKIIRNKHVLHLCGNPMQFTLMNTEPSEKINQDFTTFKQYWRLRNMDGLRTKMVSTQKSVGDAGLLFYYDFNGCVKARLLSYEDGYVLCPHNDDNGDRILESVVYTKDDVDYIDSYDEKYMYRYMRSWDDDSVEAGTWKMQPPVEHGFSEIPLITKRGAVAWNDVQSLIEVYEVIYNIFLVIQKRHGWGILYIKGKFKDEGKKIAGAIVLNDTSIEGNGSAEFKAPPSPEGMMQTLTMMEETIQKSSGCTIILPKDISLSGDISGVAVEISMSFDNETALMNVIDWQNVADKMARLFKEGLAKELVNKGINPTAITDFEKLMINAKFKVWKPRSETDYNNMIIALKQSGCISEDTAIEKNTESSPDEKMRRQKEKDEELALKEKELSLQYGGNDNNSSDNSQNTGNSATQNNNSNNNNGSDNKNSGQGDAND